MQGVAGGGLFGDGAGRGGGVENEAGAILTVSQSTFTGDLAQGGTGGGNARKRYATAQEMASDLRRFSRNEPILARPLTLLKRTRRWAEDTSR